MIRVAHVAPHDTGRFAQGVFDLLSEVNEEFVPPLADRTDTVALRPAGDPANSGVLRYFQAMQLESWLVALERESVVGFLSYVPESGDPALAAWSPSLYATTVAVSRRARRAGVATALYDAFEKVARERDVAYLTTRTWTTNFDHLRLLLKRGFRQVLGVADDRQAGIGTVYLMCTVEERRP